MPITPPRIDDRNFNELVDELISRIPAHTPEWTHPRIGDPGRTQLELFAWLVDSLLYRANLIPEKQRLTFLSLLGIKMQPAVAARGVISLAHEDKKNVDATQIGPLSKIAGASKFETIAEVTVLPVSASVYYKRKLDDTELNEMGDLLLGLTEIYNLDKKASPYATTPLFVEGQSHATGFDIISETIDKSLWVALFAQDKDNVDAVRKTLGGKNSVDSDFQQRILNIGIMPSIEVSTLFEEVGERGKINIVWEISTGKEINLEPEYMTLDVIADSSVGLSKRGVQRLLLPGEEAIGAPSNDVRTSLNAGVGDRPPRIDDEDQAARLVTWLRIRPVDALDSMKISWLDINAVEIDQKETIRSRVIGQSDGSADQVFVLPGKSVDSETLHVQVEEAGYGYVSWANSQIAIASRDDAIYQLDSEAGTITFGDGVRGRIPASGKRIRVALMRAGGGIAGNLPLGSLSSIQAVDLTGKKFNAKLKVRQSLPTDGGRSAETLNAAEKRIPLWLQHRNRAVTANDYRSLVAETPGVNVGRVEVLPRFLPQQRKSNIPGVVSVMVLPSNTLAKAPNPRPDRPFIEKVYDYLSARKPVATELYVIGCEYVQLGLSVAFELRDGYGHDETVNDVKQALRNYLWSLAPLGPNGSGWPLGKTVSDRELEVVVSRVAGVEQVGGLNIFVQADGVWKKRNPIQPCAPIDINLKSWQLPELLSVVAIVSDGPAPDDLTGVPDPFDSDSGIAVPIVPEVC